MKNTILRCISVVCLTAISGLLIYFEHPYIAAVVEVLGLAIIFDALDKLIDLL